MRVQVRPELLRWARERAGLSPEALARRIPQLQAWERGDAKPTLKQVEKFAKATYTPVGFLFLLEPPIERVPIPDFRTVATERIDHPSPDLLDTVYVCQQRQEWYRDFARSEGEDRLPFSRLARFFKVSTLVILRRLHDAGALSRDEMWQAYHEELARLQAIPRATGCSASPSSRPSASSGTASVV